MHVIKALVFSGILACWTLALVFGIHEVRQSLKTWFLPDVKFFGLKVLLGYLFAKLVWLGAGVGLIVVSIWQIVIVWTAVLAL